VVSGQDVVNAIKKGDVITRVEIIRVGDKAEAFKADQESFEKLLLEADKDKAARERAKAANAKELRAKDLATIKEKWPDAVTTDSGLQYLIIKEGNGGTKPRIGDIVSAHYTGTFLDGRKFDSSVDRGQPIRFPVGVGQVIKGWDEALLDMTQGEKRILIIPPELAYGPRGRGPIPPNATLVFEVELVDF
jgi:peptidylprolyl isomerase